MTKLELLGTLFDCRSNIIEQLNMLHILYETSRDIRAASGTTYAFNVAKDNGYSICIRNALLHLSSAVKCLEDAYGAVTE